MLNLRYAEQPWWYLSVVRINEYFDHQPAADQKPYLIVAHPPFLFDFYGNDRYQLLPLTPQQEFRKDKRQKLWGAYDYSDYLTLYESLLQQGKTVYLTNYGLGNDKGYHADYDSIQQHFDTQLMQTGCYDLCNIYQLTIKK